LWASQLLLVLKLDILPKTESQNYGNSPIYLLVSTQDTSQLMELKSNSITLEPYPETTMLLIQSSFGSMEVQVAPQC